MGEGMSAAIRILCACLISVAVCACGSSSSSGSSDRAQIEHVFVALESSMAKGDYTGACNQLSSHQQSVVVSGAEQAGVSASDCPGAFSALIKKAGVSKAQLAQAFGGGGAFKFHSVVIHGNQATVSYTTTTGGKTFNETDALVKENGAWKADRTISRTGS
jgi:hypothetical protein